jgi:serine O-acetyltransferase
MKEDSFGTIIKADFQRYTGSGKNSVWKTISTLYHHESLIIVISFRLIQKLTQLNIPFFPVLLKLILKIPSVILGINIDFGTKIGKGFYIMHYGGIFIGAIEMGKYCNVSQQVTIGYGGRGTDRHVVVK